MKKFTDMNIEIISEFKKRKRIIVQIELVDKIERKCQLSLSKFRKISRRYGEKRRKTNIIDNIIRRWLKLKRKMMAQKDILFTQ